MILRVVTPDKKSGSSTLTVSESQKATLLLATGEYRGLQPDAFIVSNDSSALLPRASSRAEVRLSTRTVIAPANAC